MQRNNGASLCQLAPIRRTYRLCQNRRRPNCSSMALTRVGGEFYTRGLNTPPLATQLGAVEQGPEGWGGKCLWYTDWWQHGSSCEESLCLGWRGSHSRVKGEQRGATLLLKDVMMTWSSRVRLQEPSRQGSPPRPLSRKQHGACSTADKGLLYSWETDLTSAWNNKGRNKKSL